MSGKARKLYLADPLVWCRSLRDLPVSAMGKLVGHVLAMHINMSSKDARISVNRLAFESGTSKRTVIRALAELEAAGLVHVYERGSNSGRQARASRYAICTHDGLDAMRTSYERWLKEHDPLAAKRREPPIEQVPA